MIIIWYSGGHISWHELVLAGNQGNHQNFIPFEAKKKSKWLNQKNSTYMAVRLSDIKAQKQAKNTFFVLGCFWAYVGQLHSHIGWATSMPFVSINPSIPRTNPWNFSKNCSAFGGGWKTEFESAILNFLFRKKKLFSA